jgi:aspartate carbamoyltransferase
MGNKLKHLITVDDFTIDFINLVFGIADGIVENPSKYSESLIGKILTTNFYEPSTRTSASFQAAMLKLGGSVIPINEVAYSSVTKGETLPDTIRTLAQYSDVIALRHPDDNASKIASNYSEDVPIINAGNGTKEHVTQAMLDLYTIYRERKTIDGLTVTFVGDLLHGRTVHSLVKLLRKYDVKINFVSPECFKIPTEYLIPNDFETDDLKSVLHQTDVLYVTRIQKERFNQDKLITVYTDDYCINKQVMEGAKPDTIVLHPFPRNNEINTDFDDDPRAAYFRQIKNGLYIRMALLLYLLNTYIY